MTTLLLTFLLLGLVGFPLMLFGYVFAMGALWGKKNKMPPLMVTVCTVMAAPFVALDGLLNIFWGTLLCWDWRWRNAFKVTQFKGVPLILPELLTERFSRYGETLTERPFRRYIAAVLEGALGKLDPKGWHFRGEHQRINWLYKSEK